MRSIIAVAALCGLVTAAPKPQKINASAVNNAPTPTGALGPDIQNPEYTPPPYDPTSAASAAAAAITTDPASVKRSVGKRGDCSEQPGG
jgi:hypothetical protein